MRSSGDLRLSIRSPFGYLQDPGYCLRIEFWMPAQQGRRESKNGSSTQQDCEKRSLGEQRTWMGVRHITWTSSQYVTMATRYALAECMVLIAALREILAINRS